MQMKSHFSLRFLSLCLFAWSISTGHAGDGVKSNPNEVLRETLRRLRVVNRKSNDSLESLAPLNRKLTQTKFRFVPGDGNFYGANSRRTSIYNPATREVFMTAEGKEDLTEVGFFEVQVIWGLHEALGAAQFDDENYSKSLSLYWLSQQPLKDPEDVQRDVPPSANTSFRRWYNAIAEKKSVALPEEFIDIYLDAARNLRRYDISELSYGPSSKLLLSEYGTLNSLNPLYLKGLPQKPKGELLAGKGGGSGVGGGGDALSMHIKQILTSPKTLESFRKLLTAISPAEAAKISDAEILKRLLEFPVDSTRDDSKFLERSYIRWEGTSDNACQKVILKRNGFVRDPNQDSGMESVYEMASLFRIYYGVSTGADLSELNHVIILRALTQQKIKELDQAK